VGAVLRKQFPRPWRHPLPSLQSNRVMNTANADFPTPYGPVTVHARYVDPGLRPSDTRRRMSTQVGVYDVVVAGRRTSVVLLQD
jgi:hypothetical protein